MKKLLLLMLFAALCILPVSAADFIVDGISYDRNSNEQGTCTVARSSPAYSGDVVIPESVTYDGIEYSVTQIGSSAFYDCSGLTSVNIPNSVTKISGWAFSGCSSLTSVYIPDLVTEIHSGTFYGCSSLVSVAIPNYVSTIDNEAFCGCSSLTSIYIPNSVITINTRAFYRCSGLTSVTYLAEEPVFRKSRIFDDETYQKATLNYLKSAEEKIASTEPWSLFVNRIGRDADYKEEGAILEVQSTDGDATAVYDMRGVKVGESTDGLPHGIYIIRQGSKTTKHAI